MLNPRCCNRPAMDELSLIRTLLEHGDGVLLRREARVAGVSDKVLLAARRRGQLATVTRGAYAAAVPAEADAHRMLLGRAALRLYPDAHLAGTAAVAAWGVPVVDVDPVRLDLVRPVPQEVLTRELRIRPVRHPPGRTDIGPAEPLAPALIQMARDVGILSATTSIDAALHEGKVTRSALESAAEAVHGWPASSKATCALAWADGRSESVGESLTRVHLTAAGIMTTPQVEIRDRSGAFVARSDLGVDGTRVLIEFDGKVKYADGGADALFAEKRREDRLRRLGFIVVRVVWADLYRPAQLVARVREAIVTAA